jgi:hypothetical protein
LQGFLVKDEHAIPFDFSWSLARCLAHSSTHFAREEWAPVQDARGDGKSGDGTETQEETNEQVAGEASGTQSSVIGASGNANVGGVNVSGVGGLGRQNVTVSGRAGQSGGGAHITNNDITTVESSDPAVSEAAINGEENTAGEALEANYAVTQQATALSASALADNESVATASIQSGVDMTALNDQFGEDALQTAANAEANATTGLEAGATESSQVASNALAAAQNETLAGITPGQEFEGVGSSSSSQSVSTIATWVTVAVGLITLIYFFRKGKLA